MVLDLQSNADLLTVLSDRIAGDFNRSGATRTVALDRVLHAGLLHQLKIFEISVQVFGLIFSFLSNGFRWFWIGSCCRNIQLMLELLRAPFLVLKFFYYTLMTSIPIYADDTTLYCKCDQTSDLW